MPRPSWKFERLTQGFDDEAHELAHGPRMLVCNTTVSTSASKEWRFPVGGKLTALYSFVETAPSGGNFTFDVLIEGTSIFDSSDRPFIESGDNAMDEPWSIRGSSFGGAGVPYKRGEKLQVQGVTLNSASGFWRIIFFLDEDVEDVEVQG